MSFKELKCYVCGGSEFEKLGLDTYKCKSCDAVFKNKTE